VSKIVFSSDQLPPELPTQKRQLLWQELYSENIARSEFEFSDAPFSAKTEFVLLGSLVVGRFSSTANRSRHPPDRTGADRLSFVINRSAAPMLSKHHSHETILAPGAPILITTAEPGGFSSYADVNSWVAVSLPKSAIAEFVPHVEDLVVAPLTVGGETLRLLGGYADLMVQQGVSDPVVSSHAAKSLIDLVALTLGAAKDAAQQAQQGGLKSARLEAILRAIVTDYAIRNSPSVRLPRNCVCPYAMCRTSCTRAARASPSG
jgi:hypothetical protein